MGKDQLRQDLIAERLNLSDEEVGAKSVQAAMQAIRAIDWVQLRSVHVYTTIAKTKEVDTEPLLTRLRQIAPNLQIVRGDPDWNARLPHQKFDAVIVPVLGFDYDRNRLGMGGGWYDRFLAAQPHAIKIGLAYEFGHLAQLLAAEPHDIRLDKIITEHQVY